jgi:hypothetical protein
MVFVKLGKPVREQVLYQPSAELHLEVKMSISLKSKIILAGVASLGLLAGCSSPPPAHHPAYLHALSDLRASRWLIEHRPGDWAQTAAVGEIDAAINEIKHAAYDDGKDLNYHPPIDEIADHRGRIHQAIDYMRKARSEIAREEDNAYADHLRDHAIHHIDVAIGAARNVFHE